MTFPCSALSPVPVHSRTIRWLSRARLLFVALSAPIESARNLVLRDER